MWQRILVFSWNQFFKISLIAISALTIHIQVLKRVDSSLCLLIFSNNEKMNSSKTDVCLIHLMLIGTWCARNYLLNIFWAPKRYTKPWWSDKKVSSCLADTFQLTHLLKPLAVRSKFFRKTRCNSKHVWQKKHSKHEKKKQYRAFFEHRAEDPPATLNPQSSLSSISPTHCTKQGTTKLGHLQLHQTLCKRRGPCNRLASNVFHRCTKQLNLDPP